MTSGGYIVINEANQEIQRVLPPETDEEIREAMLFECPVSQVVFRKEIWEKVGGYREEYNDDWDLCCRFGKLGKLYNFQEYFTVFLDGQQNKTKYIVRENLKNKLRLRKRYRNDYPHFLKNFLYGIGCYFYSFLPAAFRQFLRPIISKTKEIIFNPVKSKNKLK